MKKISAFLLLISCFLAACTPYQPSGLTGGYKEMALSKDTYEVSFRGNGYTSRDRVRDYLLRRCADLTVQNGYKYFIILNSNVEDNRSAYVTPTSINSTSNGMYNGNPYSGFATTNSSTTISGGQVYSVDRFTGVAIIRMLRDNKQFSNSFDANIILSNFRKTK